MARHELTGGKKGPDPNALVLGEKVRAQRAALGMKQEEFADLVSRSAPPAQPRRKVHQTRISKWENGDAHPRPWGYVALSVATMTPLRYWLLSEITDPSDPAAFEEVGGASMPEDMRLLMGIVERYGARAVLDKFLGLPSPPAPDGGGDGFALSDPAPPRRAPEPKGKPAGKATKG